MLALRSRAGRAWRGVARFAEGRYAAPALVLAALAVYALVSAAWPLQAGRDLGTYLRVYLQLFDPDAIYPQAMAARTPLGSLVAGALLDVGGTFAELAMAVLYALSVLAWCAVARGFGPATAVATAVGLLAFPGYAMLFHRLSTDALFAAAFAGTAVLAVRALERPTPGRAVLLGTAVAVLVLIRPSSQVFLVLGLVPLVAAGSWRARLVRSGAFAAAAVLPLVAWAAHNAVRFDDFTVARGAGTTVPFFRAFVTERIVSPGNGPASQELARAVETGLLPYEPYRSYGIDLDEFFSSGSPRMHEDFIGLSDRTWGWDDDYAHVAAAGREAVRTHPWTYVRGVVEDVGIQLRTPLYLEPSGEAVDAEAAAGDRPGVEETIVVNGRRLPKPTEDEPIPAARQSGFVSTPDGSIREVWTSPTDHHVEFRDPRDAERAAELDRRMGELFGAFPDRGGSALLQRAFNRASKYYPRSILLLAFGALAMALRRPRGWPVAALLAGSSLLLVTVTMLGLFPVAEYAVPLTPTFVLLAAAGAVGAGARRPAFGRRAQPAVSAR